MKNSVSILITISILFFLQSCFTPRSVLIVKPSDENIEWNQGRAIFMETKDDIQTRIGYEDYDKKHLIFNVEITNLGNEKVVISPENTFLTDQNGYRRITAINPEQMIFDMEVESSKKEAARRNGAIAGGILVTAAVVTDIATNDGKNCRNDYWYYSDNDNTPPPKPITDLSSFWKEETLRRTDLMPGYRIHGRVLFNRLDHLKVLNINFPIGDLIFEASYNQQVIKP